MHVLDKRIARLEEVDVGIPQRIVGVENQVERFTRTGIHQFKVIHHNRAVQSALSVRTVVKIQGPIANSVSMRFD
jgi:hypothetical protein